MTTATATVEDMAATEEGIARGGGLAGVYYIIS